MGVESSKEQNNRNHNTTNNSTKETLSDFKRTRTKTDWVQEGEMSESYRVGRGWRRGGVGWGLRPEGGVGN